VAGGSEEEEWTKGRDVEEEEDVRGNPKTSSKLTEKCEN
jgi:hypothetical protein